MLRDIAYVVMAIGWAFINFQAGDNLQAVMWFVILFYAATNYTEHRLKGTKYDY